jgi:hypothetical protein
MTGFFELSDCARCSASHPASQGGDDVVFDFSIRVRHAATSDDIEDASRWWTRPQERILRLGSIAIPRQSFLTQNALYDCEHMVFNPWNSLPEHRPLGR